MRLGAVVIDPSARDAFPAVPAGGNAAEAAPAFRLLRRDGALVLEALADPALGTLAVDFLRGAAGWRGGARALQERLVRACRARPAADGTPRQVVDGTGGLGTDAWLLASAGAEVRILEQHPIVRALLADGLARAAPAAPAIRARLALHGDDTRHWLAGHPADAPDCLYLDPMYPVRRKRALGDRRLRLLGALLAADALPGDDAKGLVRAGLAAGVGRVVLKCPLRARPEGLPAPNHSLAGRSTRFDVWISPSRSPAP